MVLDIYKNMQEGEERRERYMKTNLIITLYLLEISAIQFHSIAMNTIIPSTKERSFYIK